MSRKPQFKRHFRWEVVPDEGVFLFSEKDYLLLRGAAYLQVAPFLNGQYTEEEIVAHLAGQRSAPEVFYVLERLRRDGYVVDATSLLTPEQAAFWEMLDTAPETAALRLQETAVSLVSLGQIDATPFKTMLELLGLRVAEAGELGVVLTDDYLQNGLDALNREFLGRNQPWLLVKPLGTELWLGPLFIPSQTGCWACLAHRLRGHRKVETYLAEKKGLPGPFPTALSALPSTLQTAFSLAATEIAKWLVCDQNANLSSNVVTLNTLTLEQHHHLLVRRPQCPHCGDPNVFTANQFKPLILQNQEKIFTTDGGHRGRSPEETFQNLEHHLSPITGIVGILRRISMDGHQNELMPSYVTDHNFALVEENLYFMHESIRGRSGGKGKSEIQARVSALCESIERYAGVFHGDEARVRGKFKDMGDAVHPNACMLFSEQQFKNRMQWNEKFSRFNWVPERFDEDEEIDWSPVWSLTCNTRRYVPTAYCYYGYSRQARAWFTRADANGCAAGNSKTEAILQGFMELVERDSVALWWYNRLKKPGVDLSSFAEPYFQNLLAHYQTINRDLWMLDLTGDLNIPAFAAISRRNDQAVEDIMFGFGAHFDPKIGILRALTELNQMLPWTGQKPKHRPDMREAIEWWSTATVENQPYLTPDSALPPKVQVDYPKLWQDDLYTDVLNCTQLVRAKGLEMLVLDQTRPDVGLHVVKVIVPGLRHFWARFGPGRLYEVPVQMGWLAEPLPEEQLNPNPMFL
jgi:ribosomal protein S12 methylthiotransferase accessory factor